LIINNTTGEKGRKKEREKKADVLHHKVRAKTGARNPQGNLRRCGAWVEGCREDCAEKKQELKVAKVGGRVDQGSRAVGQAKDRRRNNTLIDDFESSLEREKSDKKKQQRRKSNHQKRRKEDKGRRKTQLSAFYKKESTAKRKSVFGFGRGSGRTRDRMNQLWKKKKSHPKRQSGKRA